DTPFSRIMIGRSVATIAELSLVVQWALLMREAGKETGVEFASLVSRLLVPIIVIAEMSSWYAVLTTHYLAHAIENSLWTLAAMLVVAGLISLWPRVHDGLREFLLAAIGGGVVFVAFVDVVGDQLYSSRRATDTAP